MRNLPDFLLHAIPLELIHEQAGPRLLLYVRRCILAVWIGKVLLDPLWRLAELPSTTFHTIGLLQFFPDRLLYLLLSAQGLFVFYLALLFLLLLCFWNRWFFLSSTAAAFFLTTYSCLIRGFGPAVHTDVVLLLAFYALCGFAWADRFSSPVSKPTSSYPLITIVLLLCLTYSLVGLNRLFVGGPGVFTGSTMEVWTIDASLRAYYFNTGIGWHLPQWPWAVTLLRLGLPVTTFFEITAPLCLVSRLYRWIFIPTMAVFHLLSLVLMNILFFENLFLYLLLIDWSRYFPLLSQAPLLRPVPNRSRGRALKERPSLPGIQ